MRENSCEYVQMPRFLKFSDARSMPWKNGLGSTAEIYIEPETAQFPKDNYDWRLSAATVGSPGPFSNFSGYDRWLVVWRGEGLLLNETLELRPLKPLHFLGEDVMEAKLVQGPVTDFGIIFHRKRIQASMIVHSLTKDQPYRSAKSDKQFVVFVAHGNLQTKELRAQEGDVLIFRNEDIELTSDSKSVICVIEIFKR